MPTYEYECKECGKIFECFQSIKARAKRVLPTECEKCNNRAPVMRLIGAGAGIIFKGSGFYETDYRSDSYNKAAKADQEASSGKKSDKDGKKGDKSKSSTTSSSESSSSKADAGEKKSTSSKKSDGEGG